MSRRTRVACIASFMYAALFLSLLQNLWSLVPATGAVKLIGADFGAIVLIVLQARAMNAPRFSLPLWLAGGLAVVGVLFAQAFALGYTSGGELAAETTLTEARIWIHYFINLAAWSWFGSSVGSGRADASAMSRILIAFFAGSLFGSAFYIGIGNYLVRELGDFIRLVEDHGPLYREAFSFAAANKYKVSPYVPAFLVGVGLSRLFQQEGGSARWLALVLVASLVALLSNMRSALLGVVIAAALAGGSSLVWSGRMVLLPRVATWTASLGIAAMLALAIVSSAYRSFDTQVVGKGFSEEFGRTDAVVEAFTLESVRVVGPAGRGLGAALERGRWRSAVNPKDSASEHAVLSGGLPMLTALATTLVLLIIGAGSLLLLASQRPPDSMRATLTGLAAAAASLVVNHYNDSHLLYVPNAAAAGLIIGITLSLGIKSRSVITMKTTGR